MPVPDEDSSDLGMPYDPSNDDGGHPPGGGPPGSGPGYGPSPDEPPVSMDPWHGSTVLKSRPRIESTYAVACTCVLLPGQSAGKKDPVLEGDFPSHDEPASSSSGPAAVPGLPVTEGEFPTQQTPLPETAGAGCWG